LDKALGSPQNVAALVNDDGSVDLVLELSAPSKSPPGDPWTESWRPFNSSGIAVGTPRFRYLTGARLPGLLRGPIESLGRITATEREVFFSMHHLAPVQLGPEYSRDLLVGSRQGTLVYYRNHAQ